MNKWFKVGIVGMVLIGALAVLLTGAALAQEDTPTPDSTLPPMWGRGFGRGFGSGLGGEVGLQAAADVLGMTADELSTQLWGGKTLADLAEDKGVDLADVQASVQAAYETATRERIEQAVEDGYLTRDHADWLLEGLDKGFWGGFGFGGRGGFHGHGFRGFEFPSAPTGVIPSGDNG